MSAIKPIISVLIPCYNKSQLISQVVSALLNQTYPPDEIIIVDDASPDNSVDIIRQLPVKLICHKENKGPAIARNTAIETAKGDILVFIDSDAYADEHLIETLMQGYDQNNSESLGGVGGRGIETQLTSLYDRWRSIHSRQDFGSKPRNHVPYLFGLCMSYKREALEKIGGFDPYYPINAGEDLDLGLRLRRAGYWLRYVPEAIVYHQHTDDEQSLKRVQYNWYFWSYLAKKRTGFPAWTFFAGTLRRLVTDTVTDLIIRKDAELAKLNIEISKIKFSALLNGEREYIRYNIRSQDRKSGV